MTLHVQFGPCDPLNSGFGYQLRIEKDGRPLLLTSKHPITGVALTYDSCVEVAAMYATPPSADPPVRTDDEIAALACPVCKTAPCIGDKLCARWWRERCFEWEQRAARAGAMRRQLLTSVQSGASSEPAQLERTKDTRTFTLAEIDAASNAEWAESGALTGHLRPDVAAATIVRGVFWRLGLQAQSTAHNQPHTEPTPADGATARGAEFNADAALAALVAFVQVRGFRCASSGVVQITGRTSVRIYAKRDGSCVIVERAGGDTSRRIIKAYREDSAQTRLVNELRRMEEVSARLAAAARAGGQS